MALPLYELGMETEDQDLVRMTLLEGGARPELVNALIPDRQLEPDEQYRFHFDMTKCIGCRSCEVACNEQNGNPAGIHWRRVGELEGGVYPHTLRTYLSMGCNHCLDADCLRGCPVDAYKKDPLTGIVLHSADACIGCQYCVWNCPYSVPQFNPERGVVGKCDMCRDRLLDGREPACVNSCPENAIQIEIVSKSEWRQNYALAESPGMPPAGQTISTTRVTLPQTPGTWLERVDNARIPLEHAHPSLIAMTCAMQAAFGMLAVMVFSGELNALYLTLLTVVTSTAVQTSVFHLGRPAYAWRALKMWRRSWLSREVLCFTIFLLAVLGATACAWPGASDSRLLYAANVLGWAAVAAGLAGTLASACIYLVRARPAWNTLHTPIDFLLTSGLIGLPLLACAQLVATPLAQFVAQHGIHITVAPVHLSIWDSATVALLWVANNVVRLVRFKRASDFERQASYRHLRSRRLQPLILSAMTLALLSAIMIGFGSSWLVLATSLVSAALAAGINRYLFFVSVVPRSMGLTFLSGSHAHGKAA